MRALLDAGAEPTRWHAEGETPLMAASRTGRVDAVQLLLSKGSFVNAADPFQEETALMWASAEGHVEVVKALLAAGADPNLKALRLQDHDAQRRGPSVRRLYGADVRRS